MNVAVLRPCPRRLSNVVDGAQSAAPFFKLLIQAESRWEIILLQLVSFHKRWLGLSSAVFVLAHTHKITFQNRRKNKYGSDTKAGVGFPDRVSCYQYCFDGKKKKICTWWSCAQCA